MYFDSNGNKIFGKKPWWRMNYIYSQLIGMYNESMSNEEFYCSGSSEIGVAVLGDSAGAHFSMPEIWLKPYF